ncbi:MAG: hypothetical protein ACUVSX_03390 [Aggregatilineales bacterium]
MPPRPNKAMTNTPMAVQTIAWVRRGPRWALSLPRVGRVLLATVFGIVTTLALMPVVDGIYLAHFMALGLPVLPALVSAGFGMSMYIIGWRLIVGTVGERPTLQRATTVYFWIGTLMCLTVLALIAHGMALSLQDG